jgi:hypothetical protein
MPTADSLGKAFMVSLSNHEGVAPAVGRDHLMVRQAHHEAVNAKGPLVPDYGNGLHVRTTLYATHISAMR